MRCDSLGIVGILALLAMASNSYVLAGETECILIKSPPSNPLWEPDSSEPYNKISMYSIPPPPKGKIWLVEKIQTNLFFYRCKVVEIGCRIRILDEGIPEWEDSKGLLHHHMLHLHKVGDEYVLMGDECLVSHPMILIEDNHNLSIRVVGSSSRSQGFTVIGYVWLRAISKNYQNNFILNISKIF